MKLNQSKITKYQYNAVAFAIPYIFILMIMEMSDYIPYGDISMLYSDMYHQYFPFFVSFREALRSGDSLLYIWNMGLGMDHLGLISYYLASPLNLLSVLIPESLLLDYFSLLMPIKLGFASMFFSMFLQHVYKKNNYSIAIFGSLYALCAWALGYSWNIMWLDTFALLPLVVLGMVKLVREKKFALYTIALFFSIAANYYIGFFICIFIFLAFFAYEICCWEGFKKFLADLSRIALFSALAIGMTAFLELPTLAALQNTQSSVNKFPQGFRLNIADENTWQGLLQAMIKVAGQQNGGFSPTFKEGLPNLYCGVITTMLSFLFYFNHKIKIREKITAFVFLLFFAFSFVIRQLDYIWHGFHFTNMIPYRFSFLYSFVLLSMAFRTISCKKSYRPRYILSAALLSIAILFCSGLKDTIVICYNSILILIYTAAMLSGCYKKPKKQLAKEIAAVKASAQRRRRIIVPLLALCITAEMLANLIVFGYYFTGTSVTNYPRGRDDAKKALSYIEEAEKDNLFYRVEATHTQTLNDGALNLYNGITTFTSSANVRVTEFMRSFGYGAKNTYNRYSYEESSPVANLFLGIKYMLERQGQLKENDYFTDERAFGRVHVLKNNAYLPLGFLADSQLVNLEFNHANNPFLFQNNVFKAATGLREDVFKRVWDRNLNVTGVELTITSGSQSSTCAYTAQDNVDGTVKFSYTMDDAGLFCIYIDQTKRNSFKIYKNGTELYSESYSLPQMLSVSQVMPGDVIDIDFTCSKKEQGTITVQSAIVDDAVFQKGYYLLNSSTLDITQFSNTHIEGNIDCNRNGVLYTSIPQNGNWHAKVDGKDAQIVEIGNVMCGILLSEGNHTISFDYRNTAFSIGWKVSLVCTALFILLWILLYKRNAEINRVNLNSIHIKEESLKDAIESSSEPPTEDHKRNRQTRARLERHSPI